MDENEIEHCGADDKHSLSITGDREGNKMVDTLSFAKACPHLAHLPDFVLVTDPNSGEITVTWGNEITVDADTPIYDIATLAEGMHEMCKHMAKAVEVSHMLEKLSALGINAQTVVVSPEESEAIGGSDNPQETLREIKESHDSTKH